MVDALLPGRAARRVIGDPEAFVRKLRAHVIVDLLRRGWRPPPLRDDQAQRLLDDIERIGSDRRGQAVPRSESLNLTPHELRVLTLIAHGDTAPQAAERIGRALSTIHEQAKSVRLKLGAPTTTNAVAIAIHEGIIHSQSGWREAA